MNGHLAAFALGCFAGPLVIAFGIWMLELLRERRNSELSRVHRYFVRSDDDE